MNSEMLNTNRGLPHSPLILAIGMGAIALLARFLYIQYFAVPMPYWDQWDAEGAFLLKPWIEGNLPLADWIRTHNEHRILPGRLLTLVTFLATGQWNNVYEARVGALIFCLIPALLIWLSLHRSAPKEHRWLLVLVAITVSVLPFGWENFLVGFQGQFYILILFSILAMVLAATQHENIIAMACVLVLCIITSLTVASGLLTPVAAGATYILACICLPGRRWPAIITTLLLAVLAVYAYTKVPVIPAHRTLQVQNPFEFIDAISHVLGWPVVGQHWAAFVLWLPCVLVIGQMLLRRKATETDLIMAGLCAWSILQGVAIAYGRGQGISTPTSRYTEFFIPGFFGNAWFALRLWNMTPPQKLLQIIGRVVAIAFALTFFIGMFARVPTDTNDMKDRRDSTRIQQNNVLLYLASNDPAHLQVGHYELPYPDPKRLQALLDDPAIRKALFVEVAPRVEHLEPVLKPKHARAQ